MGPLFYLHQSSRTKFLLALNLKPRARAWKYLDQRPTFACASFGIQLVTGNSGQTQDGAIRCLTYSVEKVKLSKMGIIILKK